VSPLEVGVALAEREGIDVVRIAGELDLTTVSDAHARISEADSGGLVLDLTQLTFLDSAAVHLLFRTVRRYREEKRRLAFVVPSGSPAHRIVEILDLGSAAPVCPTLDEAMEALDPDAH
jgi:anti-anti-sigma factor